jgi:hypothetical protein
MRAAVLVLAACGGGDEPPVDRTPEPLPCAAVEPLAAPQPAQCFDGEATRCGGDPAGTWVATTRCDDGGGIVLGESPTDTTASYACAGDSLTTVTTDAETLILGDDGRFTWEIDTTVAETWGVPGACLDELGFADCAALAEAYQFPCAAEGDGCSCVPSSHTYAQFVGGNWEVCEASLVLVSAAGTVTTTSLGTSTVTAPIGAGQGVVSEFCADGDTLRLYSATDANQITGFVRAAR